MNIPTSVDDAANPTRCAYTHQFDGSQVRDSIDWQCPHEATESDTVCIFHQPVDEKDDERVVEAFIGAITDPGTGLSPDERLQFIGANFESLTVPMFTELAVTGLKNPDRGANRIDLRDATVAGDLSFRESTLRHGCTLAGAEIAGNLNLVGATIEGDVELLDVDCGGEWSFGGLSTNSILGVGSEVGGSVTISGAELTGNFLLHDCRVALSETASGGLNVSTCRIAERAKLAETEIEGDCSFADAELAHELNLVGGKITGSLSLADARIDAGLSLTGGELSEDLRANGLAVDDMLLLGDYRLGDRVRFSGARIETVYADPTLLHPAISVVEFTNSEIGQFTLSGVDTPDLVYDFSEAHISGIEIDCVTPASPLRHFRFLKTEFSAYDFESLKPALVAEGWDLLAYADDQAASFIQQGPYLAATQRAGAMVAALSIHPPTAAAIATDEGCPDSFTELAHTIATNAFEADVAALVCDPDRDAMAALLGTSDVSLDREQTMAVSTVSSLAGYDDRPEFVSATTIRDELVAVAAAVAEGEDVRDAERDLVAEIIATLDSDVDLEAIDREATYRKAKIAAENEGAQEVASKFFQRELRERRARHKERQQNAPTLRDWVTSTTAWGSNWLLDVTTGYGERPGRVIALAVFIVTLFTGLYALLLPTDPPYGSPLGYAVLSLESFITLVLGSTETIDEPLIRFIAEVEGFLGAFSVALFVFTLTRSIHR
ncbi:hypothetical protein HUG10_07435 [Halorarum halophilum]|uniref:Pentapeptide repeat-containing protein n=1 Tax=Halorarum halophilum TaxID=2743090 RepID=A0A7D5GX13_9EURY|nr:hypothetical protein [Halobaculum halophilum]QLG27389.1 hypothetical protein HUG10_07435 [Halobaculum halophilum]